MADPVLSAKGLVKRYGRVVAMDGTDFELMPGEILGVIGDNGAGKSTLIKALSGALRPDSGEIWMNGKPVSFASPIQARETGIETVYQTLALSPALTIAENLFMGREILRDDIFGKVLRASPPSRTLTRRSRPFPAASARALRSREPPLLAHGSSFSMSRPPHLA